MKTIDNGNDLIDFCAKQAFTNSVPIARSTELLLGTTPSLYNPALQNGRVKRDLLRREKQKSYPYGFDLPGTIYTGPSILFDFSHTNLE